MLCKSAITVAGRTIGNGQGPLTCTPLVGKDETAVLRELAAVLPQKPDLLEWRVDCFAGIGDVARVVAQGQAIRVQAGETPIIFTRRSIREGGTPLDIDEERVFEVYAAVARSGCIDLIDYELSCGEDRFSQVVALARETGVRLIASYHNFKETPPASELVAKFSAMEQAGADVAKIAVMPETLEDVLTLLGATLEAHRRLSIPVISMSMGSLGAVTRLCGWMFGSAVTFAVGEQSSAPGQIPLEDVQAVVATLQRAQQGGAS
jgi:3-dehydroquinate dehydratase-1